MSNLKIRALFVSVLICGRTPASLIDGDTPQNARSRVGFDGKTYQIVFSDEFNTGGRTFKPGDDPKWEAVNLFDSKSADLQWYEPGQLVPFPLLSSLLLTARCRPGHDEEWSPRYHSR